MFYFVWNILTLLAARITRTNSLTLVIFWLLQLLHIVQELRSFLLLRCLHIRRNSWWLWPLLHWGSMCILGHLFISKFLKEIWMTVIVIYCIWTSQPRNLVQLLLFLPSSASVFLKGWFLKNCINQLVVIVVHNFSMSNLRC